MQVVITAQLSDLDDILHRRNNYTVFQKKSSPFCFSQFINAITSHDARENDATQTIEVSDNQPA